MLEMGLLDLSVVACCNTSVITYPNDAFDCAIMRKRPSIEEEFRFGIRSIEIKYANFFLLTARQKMGCLG